MKQKSSTRLVLICGLPASGKTTLGRELARRIPAIRLNKDQWTTQLGHDVWDDEFRLRVEAQLWALTRELLAQGQSVILEWGHWARVERDEKRLGARSLGVGVELHYLDAPLEELYQRCDQPGIVRPLRTSLEEFRQLHEKRRSSYEKALLRISTAGKNIAAIVEEIISGLNIISDRGVRE